MFYEFDYSGLEQRILWRNVVYHFIGLNRKGSQIYRAERENVSSLDLKELIGLMMKGNLLIHRIIVLKTSLNTSHHKGSVTTSLQVSYMFTEEREETCEETDPLRKKSLEVLSNPDEWNLWEREKYLNLERGEKNIQAGFLTEGSWDVNIGEISAPEKFHDGVITYRSPEEVLDAGWKILNIESL